MAGAGKTFTAQRDALVEGRFMHKQPCADQGHLQASPCGNAMGSKNIFNPSCNRRCFSSMLQDLKAKWMISIHSK
jgi:hypothetical protein